MRTETITVRMPDRVMEELGRWAEKESRSRNNLINKILAEAVAEHRVGHTAVTSAHAADVG